MRRSADEVGVPLAFVDLFACGLGAMMILWFVFLASTPEDTRFQGDTAQLMIRVKRLEGDQGRSQLPVLGVSLAFDGKPEFLNGFQGSFHKGTVLVNPPSLGSPAYTVLLRGASFESTDYVYVFLNDYRIRPQKPVVIEYQLDGPRTTPPAQFTLTARHPCQRLSLQSLNEDSSNGQKTTTLKWEIVQ